MFKVSKKMVFCILILVNTMTHAEQKPTTNSIKNSDSNFYSKDYTNVYAKAIPYGIGIGLLTWGVYELGDTPKTGRRNVAIYWGSALVASLGVILYQSSTETVQKNNVQAKTYTSIMVQPIQEKGIVLTLNYHF